MSNFSNFFNSEFKELEQSFRITDIDDILNDEMYLIAGDFYGIQKFIFENINTKNAAKILRAKSAYVQLFTKAIANAPCLFITWVIASDPIVRLTSCGYLNFSSRAL